jgi:Sigma-70 region 2
MLISFDQLVMLLRQSPFEPCESELRFLTDEEYDEAFEQVQRLYRQSVMQYVAHITRDYDKAADLAQEVFMNVYRARSSLEKAYIYRAAKNTLSARARRQSGGPSRGCWRSFECRCCYTLNV